jgi:STE24 endopeptidase
VLTTAWVFAAGELWDTSVPGDLERPSLDEADYFTAAEFDEADGYQAFLRVNEVLGILAGLAALAFFALKGASFARESAAGRIGTGMLLGMLALGCAWLAQLPFGLAGHWWQRRHDVVELSYLDYLLTDFLSVGGEFLFISLGLLIVMTLAGIWPRLWWFAAAPALLVVMLAFAFVSPYLIPELDPLRDEQVAADAQALASSQGIPDTPVEVQEVREFTKAPNAGAAGIGSSQKVIVWDTLLDQFERPEIRVVLAHEFAHLARDHIWKLLAWTALLALPIAFAVWLATRRRGGLSDPAAVPVAVFVVSALLFLASPLDNTFTQRLEEEADWVALEETSDPDAATKLFQRFSTIALAEPRSPGWADLLLDTHPDVMERIEMAEAWRALRSD